MRSKKTQRCVCGLIAAVFLLFLSACGGETPDVPETTEVPTEQPQASEPVSQQAEEPESGRTVFSSGFALGYFPSDGLNPYLCANETNRILIGLLYEPLFQIEMDFSVSPLLATECIRGEEGGWTLHLSDNARFSDGTPVTAEDVAESLNMAKGKNSIYADRLAPMGDVEADGEAVTFQWEENAGNPTALLNIPIIRQGTGGDTVPTGSGPYFLSDGNRLTQNPDWWQNRSQPVEQIRLVTLKDGDDLICAVEQGDISVITADLLHDNALRYGGDYETVDYPTTELLFLGCNTGSGICKNREFRLSLQQAVDRETIAVKCLSGHGEASALTFHPKSVWYDQALAEKLSAADAQVLSDYDGETVELLINDESSLKQEVAGELQRQLAEGGVTLDIQSVPWETYLNRLGQRDYDLYLGEICLEPDFRLNHYFDLNGSLNFTRFSADEIDQTLAAYLAAAPAERGEKAFALSAAISEHAPLIPLCFENKSLFANGMIPGQCPATQWDPLQQLERWSESGQDS